MTRTAAQPPVPIAREADILFAGWHRWPPTPWGRPEMPGAWLLTYTTAGHGGYRLGHVQFTTSAGDVVLARRDIALEHGVPGPETWEYSYLRFDPWPDWRPAPPFTRVAEGLYRAHVRLIPTRQRIEDAFRRLIGDVRARDAAHALRDIAHGATESRRAAAAAGRRELALNTLREILLLVAEDPLEAGSLDPRVLAALQVITHDLSAPHDITSLARTAGLSASRFLHLFREQVGVPPRRAMRMLRLQQAALRLAYTSDSVGAIADQVGFSSIFDLSRGFRRAYGVSPRAYRERFRTVRVPPASPERSRRSTTPTDD